MLLTVFVDQSVDPKYRVRGSRIPLPCSWVYLSSPSALSRETTGYQRTVDVQYNQTLYKCFRLPPSPQYNVDLVTSAPDEGTL